MTTLVTDAFGCIGAWVVRRRLDRGEAPVPFDLGDDPWRLRTIVGAERRATVPMVRGDIAGRDAGARGERAIGPAPGLEGSLDAGELDAAP